MTYAIRRRCLCAAFAGAVILHGAGIATAQTRVSDAPAPRASASFGALFLDAAADFQHIGSPDLVRVLAIGAAAAVTVRSLDGRTSAALSGSPTDVFGAGETIGSARMQLAGALATFAVGRATGDARVTAIGADLIRANIVAQAMTSAIKLSTRRERPDGTRFSFPSGHSSVTFATATVLQRHLGWKAGIPAYAMASYVAASRIHDSRHFLSDVTFGAAIGLVAGRAVTIGRGPARFAVTPVAVPGGAGVAATLLR